MRALLVLFSLSACLGALTDEQPSDQEANAPTRLYFPCVIDKDTSPLTPSVLRNPDTNCHYRDAIWACGKAWCIATGGCGGAAQCVQ